MSHAAPSSADGAWPASAPTTAPATWRNGGPPGEGPRSLDGHEDAMPKLAIEGLRQVPLAPGVLDEDHLPGADAARLAVARGDLHARVQVDDVLPPGRGVPVEVIVGLDLSENDARGRQARGEAAGPAGLHVRNLHVLEVGLALLIDEQMMDLHGRSCL